MIEHFPLYYYETSTDIIIFQTNGENTEPLSGSVIKCHNKDRMNDKSAWLLWTSPTPKMSPHECFLVISDSLINIYNSFKTI